MSFKGNDTWLKHGWSKSKMLTSQRRMGLVLLLTFIIYSIIQYVHVQAALHARVHAWAKVGESNQERWCNSPVMGWQTRVFQSVRAVCQVRSGSHSSSLPPVTLPLPLLLSFGAWLRALRAAVPSASSSFFTTLCPSAAHMASASSRSCGRGGGGWSD